MRIPGRTYPSAWQLDLYVYASGRPRHRRYRRMDAARLALAAERLGAQRGRAVASVARELGLPYDALVKWARARGLVRRRIHTPEPEPLSDDATLLYRCLYCGGKAQGPVHQTCARRMSAA